MLGAEVAFIAGIIIGLTFRSWLAFVGISILLPLFVEFVVKKKTPLRQVN